MIIGAGGVSPSVILFTKSGVKDITIINRTLKNVFLKKKFKTLKIIEWINLESEIKIIDNIVNATSLGLKDGEDFILILKT